MSSATEAALRKAGQAGSSPLRRRVTRSQSREAEEAGLNDARKGKGRLAGADGKSELTDLIRFG